MYQESQCHIMHSRLGNMESREYTKCYYLSNSFSYKIMSNEDLRSTLLSSEKEIKQEGKPYHPGTVLAVLLIQANYFHK